MHTSAPSSDQEQPLTGRADFTPQEWELVIQGPPSASIIVVTAQRGGTVTEVLSIVEAYNKARRLHGQSELLDEIVAAKPEVDHTRYHSREELSRQVLANLREAIALLERKATAEEVAAYRKFVLTLADTVAHAHREAGATVSDAERAAIAEISESLQGGSAERPNDNG